MTSKELKRIEEKLEANGYKKYTACLSANNDWEWFKSFHYRDSAGQCDYQIGYRVWDWRSINGIPDDFGFDCAVMGYIDHRADLTIGDPTRFSIEQIEEIAEKHYELWMINKMI